MWSQQPTACHFATLCTDNAKTVAVPTSATETPLSLADWHCRSCYSWNFIPVRQTDRQTDRQTPVDMPWPRAVAAVMQLWLLQSTETHFAKFVSVRSAELYNSCHPFKNKKGKQYFVQNAARFARENWTVPVCCRLEREREREREREEWDFVRYTTYYYYYYYYYHHHHRHHHHHPCCHLYARYLQLYTWNKACF